jgi:hypothetical protein
MSVKLLPVFTDIFHSFHQYPEECWNVDMKQATVASKFLLAIHSNLPRFCIISVIETSSLNKVRIFPFGNILVERILYLIELVIYYEY